eukprot:3822101-Amphidinium_carterae.1
MEKERKLFLERFKEECVPPVRCVRIVIRDPHADKEEVHFCTLEEEKNPKLYVNKEPGTMQFPREHMQTPNRLSTFPTLSLTFCLGFTRQRLLVI